MDISWGPSKCGVLMEGKRARSAHGEWLSTASHSSGHSSSPRLRHTHKMETSLSFLTCAAGAFLPATFPGQTLPSTHRRQLLSMLELTHACKDFPDRHSSPRFSLLSPDPLSQPYTLQSQSQGHSAQEAFSFPSLPGAHYNLPGSCQSSW